jgi:hypothetical protein
MNPVNNIQYKAMTVKELANFYHVTKGTMRAWLKPHSQNIGPRFGHTFTPVQMRTILGILGPPLEK